MNTKINSNKNTYFCIHYNEEMIRVAGYELRVD